MEMDCKEPKGIDEQIMSAVKIIVMCLVPYNKKK